MLGAHVLFLTLALSHPVPLPPPNLCLAPSYYSLPAFDPLSLILPALVPFIPHLSPPKLALALSHPCLAQLLTPCPLPPTLPLPLPLPRCLPNQVSEVCICGTQVEANKPLNGVTAEGANVLPSRVIEDAFQHQYNKTLNYTDLKAGLQKVDSWYRDRGIFGQVRALPNS